MLMMQLLMQMCHPSAVLTGTWTRFFILFVLLQLLQHQKRAFAKRELANWIFKKEYHPVEIEMLDQ